MSAVFGLEVWLIGTPAEVDTAKDALAGIGRIAQIGEAQPMFGEDAGRVRRYARIAVTVAARRRPARPAAPEPATGQVVIDLDSRRRTA